MSFSFCSECRPAAAWKVGRWIKKKKANYLFELNVLGVNPIMIIKLVILQRLKCPIKIYKLV